MSLVLTLLATVPATMAFPEAWSEPVTLDYIPPPTDYIADETIYYIPDYSLAIEPEETYEGNFIV